MQKINILFRCEGDTGKNFGMGHIYRSISLAKTLKKKKYKIFFISNSESFIVKLIRSELNCTVLSSKKFLRNINIFANKKVILINDTFGKCNLFARLSNRYKFKIIDFDNLKTSFLKGVLINAILHYRSEVKNITNIKYFGGFKYLILRDIFLKEAIKKKKEKKSFLISSGGSDSKNFLSKITKYLLKLNPRKIYILVGPAVKKDNLIFKISDRNKNIILLRNVKNPKKYIDKSEFALVSGGNICFESVISKCKTGCIQSYFHQTYAAKFLEKKKLIVNFGQLSQLNFLKFKKKMIKLYEKENIKFDTKKTIDNLGKKRVIKILLSYLNE